MKLTIENAHQLLEEAKYDEAKEVFLDLHEANPSDARVNYGLGVVYDHENEIPLAVKHLQAAALVATKKGIVFTKLADALRKDNDLESALEAARKGAALDKKSSMAQIVLGECYDSLLRPVMARTCFENAVKLAPNLADGYIRLARHLATFGKFDDARAILSKAKEIDTTSADILILQFDLDNHENIKGILEKSKKIISKYSSETSNETAGILAFRIAKFHEKLKETDKAFEFYDQNRKLLYKDYEIERRKRQLTAYKQVFTKDFFSSREEASLGSDKPVFVFGMPRSGTTLAEQIIAQHKFANGVGECTYFTQLQKQLFKGSTYSSNIFNEISKFRAKDFKKIGNTYVKTITRDDKKSRRIVDKMPHNFEMLWMIALLFPNAHFIHMKRNP
ncbi:sulfotransferase family protein, partial [Roseibium denhamense]